MCKVKFFKERLILFDYLTTVALLGRFFEPFIFENLPAIDHSTSRDSLKEVEQCDIYIGLFGKDYGHEDHDGISSTEREFDHQGCIIKPGWFFLATIILQKDILKSRHS